MKLPLSLLVLTVSLGAPSLLRAQRQAFGNGTLPEVLQPYDVDEDGRLSVEERQAFVEATKKAARDKANPSQGSDKDTDGDGKLSPEEIAAARAAVHERILARRGERFDELDSNEDGSLSLDEFLQIPGHPRPQVLSRLFDRLDTNNDDLISKEELLGRLGFVRNQPKGPKTPDDAEPPVDPADPESPESPETPAAPEPDDAPGQPATPAGPAVPATPAIPATPDSPAVPATPATPATPAVPPTTGDEDPDGGEPVGDDPAGEPSADG